VITTASRNVTGGAALAGFQMIGDVGAVVGPILAGVVAEQAGFPAAFAVTRGRRGAVVRVLAAGSGHDAAITWPRGSPLE
jgi:hypothetical protein